jgi:hypothetical protein
VRQYWTNISILHMYDIQEMLHNISILVNKSNNQSYLFTCRFHHELYYQAKLFFILFLISSLISFCTFLKYIWNFFLDSWRNVFCILIDIWYDYCLLPYCKDFPKYIEAKLFMFMTRRQATSLKCAVDHMLTLTYIWWEIKNKKSLNYEDWNWKKKQKTK